MNENHSTTIGWALTCAGIGFYAASLSSLVEKVHTMARIAGHGGISLSWNSRMCLRIGDPLLAILPVVVLAISVVYLLRARHPIRKIVVPALCFALVVSYIVLAKDGLTAPIKRALEIMEPGNATSCWPSITS